MVTIRYMTSQVVPLWLMQDGLGAIIKLAQWQSMRLRSVVHCFFEFKLT